MFFSNEDDDGDFMSPAGSSKLASLFGIENTTSEVSNESLKYTAPKEPKKKKSGDSDDTKAGQQTKILCALAVHAYKYVDGKPEAQGKLGAAILGNQEHAEYKILLYKTKQQPVTQAKITPSFVFTLQKNNYATMYDDSRVTFSLNFETAANLEQFSKQVCIAKGASTKDSIENIVLQDLCYGEGGQLENGDSVEMKYSAWLFDEGQLGESIDTSQNESVRFKIGRGKVMKGWEEGLLGVRKAGKRFLIIPPSFGISAEIKGHVPANSLVAYEVEVLRVKLNKEREASPKESAEPSPSTTPVPDGPTSGATEEKPALKSDKAKLISRIAKMGQPMLPVTVQENEQEEVHEHEEEDSSSSASAQMKPGIPTKPTFQQQPNQQSHHPHPQHTQHTTTHPTNQPPVTQGTNFYQQPPQQVFPPAVQPGFTQVQGGVASQLAVYQPPMQMPMQYGQAPPQYSNVYGQPQAYPHAATPPSASTDVVLSETRQNNTEIRISMNKVTEKVDRIFDKVETISAQQMQLSTSTMPNMEAGVLLHNITRIVQENERLKQELFDKNNKIENQNEKINELIQRNQKYIEQSNLMLEQRSDTYKQTASSSQEKVLSLEQDKVKLTSELSSSVSQISSLQLEVTSLKKRELEIKQQLDSLLVSDQDQKTELSNLKVQNTENEKKIEQLSSQFKDEKRLRKELDLQHTTLQEEHIEVQNTCQTLEKTLSEKKKKSAEERQKLEQELEELKCGLEAEIADLKEKLKKERTSTDVQTAEQVSKVEEDINKEWKEKSERLLATAQERHRRALDEVLEEKNQLEDKIKNLEQRLSGLKSSRGEADEQVLQLKEELDDMKVWKDKYDSLRGQASNMKEKYETRIGELEKETEALSEDQQNTIEKARLAQTLLQSQLMEIKQELSNKDIELKEQQRTYQRQLQSLQQRSKTGVPSEPSKEQLSTEVKKIMSSVYTNLRSKFVPDEDYSGSAIHQTVLTTIKTVTLSLLSGNEDVKEEEEEDESEDGSEEEESEDENESESAQTTEQSEIPSKVKNEEVHTDIAIVTQGNDSNISEKDESESSEFVNSAYQEINSKKEDVEDTEYENLNRTDSLNNDVPVHEYEKLKLSNDSIRKIEKESNDNTKEDNDKVPAPSEIQNDDSANLDKPDEALEIEEVKEKGELKTPSTRLAGKSTNTVISSDAKVDGKVVKRKPLSARKDIRSRIDNKPFTTASASSKTKVGNTADQSKKPATQNKSLGAKPEPRGTRLITSKSNPRVPASITSTGVALKSKSTINDSKNYIKPARSSLSKSTFTQRASPATVNKTPVPKDSKPVNQTKRPFSTSSIREKKTASSTTPRPASTSGTGTRTSTLKKTNTLKTNSSDRSSTSFSLKPRVSTLSSTKRPMSSTSSGSAVSIKSEQSGNKKADGKNAATAKTTSSNSSKPAGVKNAKSSLTTTEVKATKISKPTSVKSTKGVSKPVDKDIQTTAKTAEAKAKPEEVTRKKAPAATKAATSKDVRTKSAGAMSVSKTSKESKSTSGEIKTEPKKPSSAPLSKSTGTSKQTTGVRSVPGKTANKLGNGKSQDNQKSKKPGTSRTTSTSNQQRGLAKVNEKKEKSGENSKVEEPVKKEVDKEKDVISAEKTTAPTGGVVGNPHYLAEIEAETTKLEPEVASKSSNKNDISLEKNSKGSNVIEPVNASVTGDRGNPYYAAELEKVTKDDKVVASSIGFTENKKDSNLESIKPLSASVTGDRGNPYYAAELEETKQDSKDNLISCSQVSSTGTSNITNNIPNLPMSSKLQAVTANITGDKGNPYYAAELEKSKPETGVEVKEVAGTQSGLVEKTIFSAAARPTGDMGNPYYAAELEKLSDKDKANEPSHNITKEQTSEIIQTSSKVSDVQELDPSIQASPLKYTASEIVPCVQAVQVQSTMSALPPISPEKKTEVSSFHTKKEEIKTTIDKEKVSVTGDKGNPYYAAELEKGIPIDKTTINITSAGKTELKNMNKSDIHAEKAEVTGDKGNPYYAEELEKPADSQRFEKEEIKSSSAVPLQSSNKFESNSNEQGDIIQNVIVPQTASITQAARGIHDSESNKEKIEKKISPEKANITGDVQELDPSIQASPLKNTAGEIVPCVQAVQVQSTMSALPPISPEKKTEVSSFHTKKEEIKTTIDKEKVSVTGDKGNPYYAAELEKGIPIDKTTINITSAGKTELKNMNKSDIHAEKAEVTGDKGNPYYAEELEKPADSQRFEKEEIKSSSAVPLQSSDKFESNSNKQGDIIQNVIVPQTASITQAARGIHDSESNKEKIEKKISPEKANITGDKGNPYYAKELEENAAKAKEVSTTACRIEAKIDASNSPVTGDRGNPYYAAELEKVSTELEKSKIPAKHDKDISKATDVKHVKGETIIHEEIISTSAALSSTVPVNKGNESKNDTIKVEQIHSTQATKTGNSPSDKEKELKKVEVDTPESGITAVNKTDKPVEKKCKDIQEVKKSTAPVTGDKGNPYYSAELEISSPEKVEKSGIKPSTAHTTGDKGNPSYAQELVETEKPKDDKSIGESKDEKKENKNLNVQDKKDSSEKSGLDKKDSQNKVNQKDNIKQVNKDIIDQNVHDNKNNQARNDREKKDVSSPTKVDNEIKNVSDTKTDPVKLDDIQPTIKEEKK